MHTHITESAVVSGFLKPLVVRLFRTLLQSPARISVLGFAILISTGTFLLMLPASSKHESIGFINALFTATSASCVTGLTVVDTGNTFSLFGQLVILSLIQAGGLGIMTISTLFIILMGKRPKMTELIVIKDTLTHSDDKNFFTILWDVAKLTFFIEGIGIAVMFFRFFPEKSAGEALYISLFHSVSAFCNAGFSIFSDSIMSYRDDWILNLIICFLVITGGIGFLVMSELNRQPAINRRSWSRLSLHTKIVLSFSFIILLTSSILLVIMEWNNTLEPISFCNRFIAGFFQAVNARTSGFNTLPIGDMANESLFFIILLMFIGASPGSCGGGIKITTFACLVMLGISQFKARERIQLFRRTISNESVKKAINIVIVSIFLIVTSTLILLMTELGDTPHVMSRGDFVDLLFEVVSAFGTVGLSTGITPELSTAGKIIISMVMFIGRLGPLVVTIAISRQKSPKFYYAEENIMIG